MEIRPEIIELVIDENMAHGFQGRRKAEILKKKIRRLAKEGRLSRNFFNAPGEDQIAWAYRIFSASIMLGDYSWWGWEARSKWAWELSNHKWFYPRWTGKPCKLLVLAEQGIGDEILFLSCARELKAVNPDLHWEVDHRLIPILQRSIPDIHWITRWKSLRPSGDNEPWALTDHRGEYDAFIPAGNVPKLFRTSKASFPREPYLIPDWDRVAEWQDKIIGAGYVNQAGASLEKTAKVPGDHDLYHHGGLYRSCRDFDDFIALVNALDYINAVPSAVVHVCGATGQKCNVIKPEVRLGEKNTILKYPYGTKGATKMDWYGDHIKIYDSRAAFDRDRAGELRQSARAAQ